MEPNQVSRPHRMPWLSLLLLALAIAAFMFSDSGSSQSVYPLFSRYSGVGSILAGVLPGLIVVGIVVLVWGIFKHFSGTDEEARKKGSHLVVWSIIALIVFGFLWFLLQAAQVTYNVTSTSPVIPKGIQISPGGYGESSAGAPASQRLIAPDYYPYPGTEVPATDTREFLKTDYNATLRTRQVQELTRRVETTVRGFDGRVDETSSSKDSGYVRFVVPASKFDKFREEIENLVNSRFLSVDIRSQNLLPQKQSIEEQQKSVEDRLAELNVQRRSTVSTHASAVRSFQSQIDSVDAQLAALQAEVTNDPVRKAQIANEKYQLQVEQSALRSRLAGENATYAQQLRSLDEQITYMQQNLSAVKTQDQKLLDTVATVRGTISLRWISLWELVQLYVPGPWIALILGLAAVLVYVSERRGFHLRI